MLALVTGYEGGSDRNTHSSTVNTMVSTLHDTVNHAGILNGGFHSASHSDISADVPSALTLSMVTARGVSRPARHRATRHTYATIEYDPPSRSVGTEMSALNAAVLPM